MSALVSVAGAWNLPVAGVRGLDQGDGEHIHRACFISAVQVGVLLCPAGATATSRVQDVLDEAPFAEDRLKSDAAGGQVSLMQNPTLREEVVVAIENGLHMVPCSRIASSVQGIECSVHIHNGDKSVDGKSVLDLMTLNAEQGTRLVIETSGSEAAAAMDRLKRLFATNFAAEGSSGAGHAE